KMMFGFARPVPVNFRALRSPRRDMVLVALAGPVTNLILAVFAAAMFHTLPFMTGAFQKWVALNLEAAVWINVLLCVFNMLPIPPLDGGRVAVGLLPRVLAAPLARLERAGFAIILGAVFVVPWIGDALGQNWNVFWWVIGTPASAVEFVIYNLVGVI
ncbi:MAG: site-2 protease family protein, partial [Rhodospirillales bacterium]|nr:site-2 protease family protein [Rhodospirillales bacterium]